MKKTLFALALIAIIAACKSKTAQKQADSIRATDTTATLSTASPASTDVRSIIQGVWVQQDYINEVIKTRSPEAAFAKARTTLMSINTAEFKGDTLVVPIGTTNHEGGEFTLTLRPGKNYAPALIAKYGPYSHLLSELEYRVNAKDTLLIMHNYNTKKKSWYHTTYVRALKTQLGNGFAYGLDHLINKGLVAGNYIATDSVGKKSKVVLGANGQINGLKTFNKYYIQNDFTTEPMNNLDHIIFDLGSQKQSSYAFKLNKDTMSLYDTYANADSTLRILGRLKYKLVRNK